MMVFYNDCPMTLEHINSWDQRPVYSEDGADYLYTHHRISLTAVFSPTTAAQLQAGLTRDTPTLQDVDLLLGGINPAARFPGNFRDLSAALKTQRAQLLIVIGGKEVLRSPLMRPQGDRAFVCDARNGPNPLSVQVTEIRGTKTAVVHFEIECWVNDVNVSNRNPLLSHRWESAEEIDSLFYSTRTITGRAVFRADVLRDDAVRAALQPDDFRVGLFHPIPSRFQRKRINVTEASDGLSVQYTVVDKQQPVNLGLNSPIARIKGTWRSGFDHTNAKGWYPKAFVSATVQLWGVPDATRQQLLDAAAKVMAAYRLTPQANTGAKWYYKADYTVDMIDKYAEFTVGVFMGGGNITPRIGFGLFNTSTFGNRADPANFPEAIDGVTTTGDGANPRPKVAGARGGYLSRMIAQSLMNGPGDAPGPVPIPSPALDYKVPGQLLKEHHADQRHAYNCGQPQRLPRRHPGVRPAADPGRQQVHGGGERGQLLHLLQDRNAH